MSIAERVHHLRKESRMTMRDLARASGVSVGTVHGVEHGVSSPRLVTLEQLAVGLNTTVIELLGEQ